jgi:hypothetical protein
VVLSRRHPGAERAVVIAAGQSNALNARHGSLAVGPTVFVPFGETSGPAMLPSVPSAEIDAQRLHLNTTRFRWQ